MRFTRPWPHDFSVSEENLRLHCVTVVNLFRLDARPLAINADQTEYRLQPLRDNDPHTEIFAVESVAASSEEDAPRYTPFRLFEQRGEMLRRERPPRYFHTRVLRGPSGRTESWLIPGGEEFERERQQPDEALVLSLTGTNGSLPRKTLQSILLNQLAGTPQTPVRVRNLCRPSMPCYPASFEDGGTDRISQCLLGLAGLGIPGTAEHLDTPLSRFLGMLPALQLPGRTAEGIAAVVSMVTPDTSVTVRPRYQRKVDIPELTLRANGEGFSLDDRPVMGGFAWDVNSTIEIRLYTESKADVRGWMPPGYTLYHDLLSLLRVYLGWRYDACISLTFPRRLLPAPRLTARDHKDSVYMGYSFLLGHDPDDTGPDPEMPDEVTIKLGRYEGLKKNPTRREVTEVED
ncbi:type VI secretion system baseplate subunit TssF [Cronobacter sakazakii]|uniref:type VI secretion system baseplate subunit TssF n=1 Tax=Cronobacter sakazakii TaxID=28141 RepID=UPI001EFCF1A7|nr:type VI secretion system baseplate subunit TssF [Cronobacter sakazakii]